MNLPVYKTLLAIDVIEKSGQPFGTLPCPRCGKPLDYSSENGIVKGRCRDRECLEFKKPA